MITIEQKRDECLSWRTNAETYNQNPDPPESHCGSTFFDFPFLVLARSLILKTAK
jgi:hypothetical protein